jgi:hypothetical protein
MPSLPVISGHECANALEKVGFVVVRRRGSQSCAVLFPLPLALSRFLITILLTVGRCDPLFVKQD